MRYVDPMPPEVNAPQSWVLLHGTPLGPDVWDRVRTGLPGTVVAPDLNSLMPSGNTPTAGAGLHRHLATAVLRQVPDDEVVVVGHSLGGQVALEMALLAPHRIRRLILVCTRDIPVPGFRDAAQALRAGDPVDVDAGIRRWFTPAEIDADGPVVRYARERLKTVAPLDYARTLDALSSYHRRDAIGGISIDCTLICGALDAGCTPAVMTALAGDLPSSTLHIVDQWAHMSPFVNAGDLAHRLRAACGPVPRRRCAGR
jgi:pimeloyl-ACP methyl ester carboxylesterase